MKILYITPRPESAVSSVVGVQIPMAHSIYNWAYGIYGRLCGIWGMRNTPAPLYMPLYYPTGLLFVAVLAAATVRFGIYLLLIYMVSRFLFSVFFVSYCASCPLTICRRNCKRQLTRSLCIVSLFFRNCRRYRRTAISPGEM